MQRWTSWMTRTTALGALGTCAAAVVWGPWKVAILLAMTSVVTTFTVLVVADDQRALLRWGTWTRIARIAVCATTLLASVSLVAQLAPALGLLAASAWAVTTPPVLERLSACTGRGRVVDLPGVRQDPPGPTSLSDEDLCRAWLRTSHDLDTIVDPERRLALVIARQHLLDEVWTRDRKALEEWVACGARAEHGASRRYFDPS